MKEGPLETAVGALVRLSGALAAWARGGCGRDDVRWALRMAADEAGTDAVEEALVQSYLFLGDPAALNGLALWREVEAERRGEDRHGTRAESTAEASARGGAGRRRDPGDDGQEGSAHSSADRDGWRVRGEEVCATVYGGQYGRLRENIRALHPEMEGWMLEEGYGKVLGRPGLALATRELCIVGLLAVSDWPTQLYSHLRGARNAGASDAEVTAALELALGAADDGARSRARETWARLRRRTSVESGESG